MSHTGFRNPFPPYTGFGFGQNVSSEDNPRVFFDISINGEPAGRMVIELFANVVPKAAECFRALCTGENGNSKITGRPLHYKGTVFHSIREGFLAVGGEISLEKDGSRGEENIFGGSFEGESHKLRHCEPGMLSVGNKGTGFYLTFIPVPFLDGVRVVFGKVIEGMSTLNRIDEMGTPEGRPSGVGQITDCGEISEDKGKKKKSLKTASSDERVKERSDEREKQISDSGETSEDKKNNLMESDHCKMKKSLKKASSSDELVKEQSDEREVRRKYPSSEETSEDRKNNVLESDQDRQEGGELRQRIDWIMSWMREIARAVDIPLPDYPSPGPQQD